MSDIIEQKGLSRPVVNKWRQRFRQHGIDGLKDAPRTSKPRVITPEQQAMVIDKACSKPDGGYTKPIGLKNVLLMKWESVSQKFFKF